MKTLREIARIPLIVWLCVVVFTVVQALTIERFSFWFDESFTSELIKKDWLSVVKLTAFDVHPPLYYILLKLWSLFFGTSTIALRSLSVLFAAVTIPVGYELVRRLSGDGRTAQIAAFLMAIGPFTFRYAQEARMYSLAGLLIAGSTLALVIQMQRPASERSSQLWLVYAALVALSQYTHNMAVLAIGGHGLYLLSLLGFAELKQLMKGAFAPWLRALVGALCMYIPWLPVFVGQVVGVSLGFWIPPVEVSTIPNTISQLLAYENVHGFTGEYSSFLVVAVYVIIIAVGLKLVDGSARKMMAALFGPTVFAMTALMAVSLIPWVSPIYTVRYFAQFAPLFYAGLGLSVGVAAFKYSRLGGAALLSTITFLMLFGLSTLYQGDGGAYGDGRSGAPARTNLQRLIDSEGLAGDEILIVSDYWQYYDVLHYLPEDRDQIFIHEGAGLDGGALLIENGDEIRFNEANAARAGGFTAVYVYSDERSEEVYALDGWQQDGGFAVQPYGGRQLERYEVIN